MEYTNNKDTLNFFQKKIFFLSFLFLFSLSINILLYDNYKNLFFLQSKALSLQKGIESTIIAAELSTIPIHIYFFISMILVSMIGLKRQHRKELIKMDPEAIHVNTNQIILNSLMQEVTQQEPRYIKK